MELMVLEVSGVSVEITKGLQILRDVSLGVAKSEIVSVIGNNGAGKTTLLRTISGFLKPSEGNVHLKGSQITGLAPSAIAKLGIAHVPEGRRIFGAETVKDNLILGGYTRWWRERRKVIEEAQEMIDAYAIVGQHSSRMAGNLSGGQQQFLAICRGLMMRPAVLLLDEPSLGLSPLFVKEMFKIIKEFKAKYELSIILVEQLAYQALRVADRAFVLERGVVVAEGTGKELLASPSIRKAYLGYVGGGSD